MNETNIDSMSLFDELYIGINQAIEIAEGSRTAKITAYSTEPFNHEEKRTLNRQRVPI